MSTSVAIATNASVMAAAAQAEADAAKKIACQAFIPGFKNDTATIAQQQTYAGCIQKLYPEDLGPGSVLAVKVLIIAALIGMLIGIVVGCRDYSDRVMSCVMHGFLGLIGAPAALCLIAALVAGVKYVISA